jgi:four helix bundle protein
VAGVRHFSEYAAWQLADQVRQFADRVALRPTVARHFRYCGQLTDAASSVTRNIAEGHGRYRHKEFANFVRVAKGSAHEVIDLLIEAKRRRFISESEFVQHVSLTRRAIGAMARLVIYLESTPDP